MESAFKLKSIQLARLLELSRDADLASDTVTEELLLGLLRRPMPSTRAAFACPTGASCAELLMDAAAGADVLVAVKEYAKDLVRNAGSESEVAAATALYYAAIGAAFVHTGVKITEHSDERVVDALADLESRAWLPAQLRDLFHSARAAFEEKSRRLK